MADVVLNLKAINDQLMKALAESEAAFRKLSEAAKKTNTQVQGTGTSTKQAGGAMSVFWGAATGSGLGTIAVDLLKKVAGAMKDVAASAIQGAAQFEQFSVVLTNTLGSGSKAAAALDMLSDFGKNTPFQLEELTAAYIQFANRGINRTTEELTKLGDLAASQNKSFDDIVQASLQAQNGEYERLKSFGISVKAAGDKISLTFKEQTQVVQKNAKAIDQAILNMGAYKGVAGGMEAISGTLNGKISNLQDAFAEFSRTLGAKALPVLKDLVDYTIKFLDSIDIDTIMANFAPISQVLDAAILLLYFSARSPMIPDTGKVPAFIDSR